MVWTTIATDALLFIALYAEVFLLLVFVEKEHVQKKETPLPAVLPTVAIIVPCFNEEKTVAHTIQSLLSLEYPADKLSIIAVNDGSTDGTREALASFCNEPRVTVLHKENGGKYTAMNMALAHTNAEYIGCLDADSYVAPHALKISMAQLLASDAEAVTPAIIVNKPRRWIELVQQAEYSLAIFMRRAFAHANAVFITPGPFSIFKRVALVKLGGWKHAHGTEDMEIAMRLQRGRMRIVNSPRTHVYTNAPSSLRKLYRQRVRWTYGFLMNTWEYRRMVGNSTYGPLGTVILPTAIISIGTVLFLSTLVMIRILESVRSLFLKIDTVGVAMHPTLPFIDIFFINTTVVALIVYTLVGLALGLIYMGRNLAQTELHPLAVPLYLLLYCWIAPLWLVGAVVRACLRAQAPWR